MTENVVGQEEAAYRPDNDPRILLLALRSAMKWNRGRFKRDGGKWVALSR
ncbi:MAG: hypothetical protein AB7V46_00130 [Thermomicrobiales bacterium]